MPRALQSLSARAALVVAAISSSSIAATLSAPVGGDSVALPEGQVICGDPGAGWQADPSGASVRPPNDVTQVGMSVRARVAAISAACPTSKDTLILVASGPIPVIDRRNVELWLDEGRLELRGGHLEGVRLEWETTGEQGSDTCVAPASAGGQEGCSFLISKKLPADLGASSLRLLPAGVPASADVFDAAGQKVPKAALGLLPTRIILSSSLTAENHVDLSTGEDRLGLTHPEAVAGAECDSGRCELAEKGVRIRGILGSTRTAALRLRLAPHVFVRNGDSLTQSAVIPLEITYCPMSVVSVPPMWDTDDVRVVVRADARCGVTNGNVRWSANGNPIPVLDTETHNGFIYALLGIGRTSAERITLAATRTSPDGAVIGQTTVSAEPPPQLRVILRLTGYGDIDFVPTNRAATLTATAPNTRGRIIALPIQGVYSVIDKHGKAEIRGEADGGYTVLRFALRDDTLPGHLAQTDLAHFSGNVQRAVKEASVAAPIGLTNVKTPIAEVLCTDATGRNISVIPGVPLHIPFAQRDGCRLIIHRERIPVEDGEQRLNVSVDVTSLAGSTRSEGHFAQRLVLRHGTAPRVIWIRGVQSQFDRITVQLTHVTDESQYLRGSGEQLEVPAGQWTVVVENTRWRLYATAAIPVQLFRFSNDPGGAGNGPLSLNLGVLSRFTWVTRDGTEGILGLEAGVMGMGLASDNTRQLNIVGGLGVAVPLGNTGQVTQASINIHAWVGYRLGSEFASSLDASGNAIAGKYVSLNHWSFIFGPSVTFGNLGFDI
jgi:hypothetical protein